MVSVLRLVLFVIVSSMIGGGAAYCCDNANLQRHELSEHLEYMSCGTCEDRPEDVPDLRDRPEHP